MSMEFLITTLIVVVSPGTGALYTIAAIFLVFLLLVAQRRYVEAVVNSFRAGIDPERSLLYHQSEVPQHVELSWILGTMTGLGQLERMTQFKEKADRARQNLGIFAYPVLQAADILVHKVHAVPVGEGLQRCGQVRWMLPGQQGNRVGGASAASDAVAGGVSARNASGSARSFHEPSAPWTRIPSSKDSSCGPSPSS